MKLVPKAIILASGRRYPAAQLTRSGRPESIHMANSRLRAAWWSQRAGLLRHELAGGEVFDLAAG